MTKAPEPGRVKTRLTPPLSQAESAALNVCFLKDLSQSIATACEQSPAHGIAVFTPVGSEASYDSILPSTFSLIPQRGDQFGERLKLAMDDLLACGFHSACLINSDSPTVPAAAFAEAARVLSAEGDRMVLGPSEDGGYYLIGLNQSHPRVFEEIDWSTEQVFDQTVARAGELRLEVHKLKIGLDVDDRASLNKLCKELFEHRADNAVAINTRSFLSDLIKKEGRERIWPERD